MRKNEHPSCNCTQCRRGKHTTTGHTFIRLVNKRLRAAYRRALKAGGEVVVAVRSPYMD